MVDRREAKWCYSVEQIEQRTDRQVIARLTKDGVLPDWSKKFCPHCHLGEVLPLAKRDKQRGWAYRCRRKGCQKFILPHHDHPIFTVGWASGQKVLRHQAKILFSLLVGVSIPQAHLLWEDHRRFLVGMSQRLDAARKRHVLKHEKFIKFGNGEEGPRADVEADEVDLGKEFLPDQNKARWEQWAGVVQRAKPSSLVLFKTKPRLTKPNAPGPGPIKKVDWTPFAKQWLKGRCVFIHTDGARSYKLGLNRKRKIEGIIHDLVVHKKKNQWEMDAAQVRAIVPAPAAERFHHLHQGRGTSH